MSGTTGRVEALLADVLPRIREIGEEAQAEISRVREEASAKMARYEEAIGELGEVEAEIGRLTTRKEELPVEVTRANLEEDYGLEDDLREEYRSIGPRLEELGVRKASLEEETAQLLPNARGHRHDAPIERMAAVAGAAFEEKLALEELRDQLTEALDAAASPMAEAHEQAKGTVESLSSAVAWEESPVGRGAVR